MIIGNRAEFEALADYILRDYLHENYEKPIPMDIADFATNYLNMKIVFTTFPKDSNVVGMRQYNYIILNKILDCPERTGIRNFTIAHECAHEVINWQEEGYQPMQMPDFRAPHPPKQLVTEEDFREWQANVVAAYLLMRPTLVRWALFTFCRAESITVFGESLIYKNELCGLWEVTKFLGVSKEALLIRLHQLGLIEARPYEEYDPIADIPLDWRWFEHAKANRIRSSVY